MRIYSHVWLLVDHRCNNIRSFPSDPGKGDKFIDRQRDPAIELVDQLIGHANQVLRLIVRIRDASNEWKQFIEGGPAETFRIGVCFEDRRGCQVDALISALSREYNGNEQLKRVVVQQLRLRFGSMLLEIIDNELKALFTGHCGHECTTANRLALIVLNRFCHSFAGIIQHV